MNRSLRSLCVIAIAGLMLITASAGAQPVVDLPRIEVITPATPEAPPPPKPLDVGPVTERMMVVAVRSTHGVEDQLAQALEDHFRRSGRTAVDRPVSSEATTLCESEQCLDDMAKRANAGLLFSTQITEGAGASFAITMSVYDAVRRTTLKESATCRECNQALLIYKLNDVADTLFNRCRDERLAPPPKPPSPDATPPIAAPGRGGLPTVKPAPAKPGIFANLSPTRKRLAIALGAMAGAALVTSIVLTVTNGLDTPIGCELRSDVLQDKCVLKNKPLYASGYALTGALAVGIGFTLFWPSKPAKAAAQEVR